MAIDFDEILRAALALPPEERAMVADDLLQSLDGPDQERIDALWAEEAERRMREIEEGKVVYVKRFKQHASPFLDQVPSNEWDWLFRKFSE